MIKNTECIITACENLKMKYEILDDNSNLIKIDLKNPAYFSNSSVPFNREDVVSLCLDKDFSYRVLKNVVNMPKTRSYLDPHGNEKYNNYRKHFSSDEIITNVLNEFRLPVIIKMNKGSHGDNVFFCKTAEEISPAIGKIFDQNSKFYDYIALAQEYISIKKEYRVIIFNKKIIFAYEKNIDEGKFTGNLSPLHWENSKAILMNDDELINKLTQFISPIFTQLDLIFGGLDIVMDSDNQMWLIELNSKPGFEYFTQSNGNDEVVKMYEILLKDLTKRDA